MILTKLNNNMTFQLRFLSVFAVLGIIFFIFVDSENYLPNRLVLSFILLLIILTILDNYYYKVILEEQQITLIKWFGKKNKYFYSELEIQLFNSNNQKQNYITFKKNKQKIIIYPWMTHFNDIVVFLQKKRTY